ncbi:MAG: hypothetical protein ACYDH5_17530 [Acidimicrobiales bacterium]
MSTSAGFDPISEVAADERARIAFGRAGVRHNDRFLVSARASGEILLTPIASIPKRELLVWENDELRRSLLRGLGDSAEGRITRRDDLLDDPETATTVAVH